MKTKKIEKKLALNKETIATLESKELSVLKGGLPWKTRYSYCKETCVDPCI